MPDAWRIAAEEVRAHLCALRGGAPFLSPADAWQLVSWFEQGVPVAAVIAALERAADVRRRARARSPLSVVAAKRHLGRPNPGFFRRDPPVRGGEHRLAPLVRAVQLAPAGPEDPLRDRLCAELLAVQEGEGGVRAALAAIRAFLEAAWDGAPAEVRGRWTAEAEAELGDLLALVDERTRVALVEETARDRLRQRYPALTAATVAELMDTTAP